MATFYGWLFDLYACGDDMTVWFLDAGGRPHVLRDAFTPRFYARGPRAELGAVCRMLRARRAPVELRRAERRDLFLARDVEVLEIGARAAGQIPRLVRQVTEFRPHLTYYDADIPLEQRYVLERGVFPLAFCAVEHEGERLRALEAVDSPWDVEYRLPPLRVMTLHLSGELRNPSRGHRGDLLVEVDGRSYGFPRRRGRELVLGMRHLLERQDPDLIVSAYGDSYIVPRLIELARHYRIPLPLNRDRRRPVGHKPAHSYFSYGQVVFRDEQHTFSGRWHIDRQNAFLAGDYGMDGTIELARLTGLPVQTVSRTSTGTGISAMQVATALRRGVLVPWQKRQPEALKTGLDLLAADKGGLVYTPIAGLHEHVAELDFTAMYPSLMVHFNLSPETVKTNCCRGTPVPELGTPVCTHREGLVPETLAPLLEKRARYKARMRSLPEDDPRREMYRRRYSAHKWLLVTCFGYLGYKNARFGRIEAHEAVTAYGREVLLQAKEIVEGRGFRVLHLYVDGLWIHKPGAHRRPDYESLLGEIEARTGVAIELEGIYRWLAFLPSRVEPRVAVANRYFGAFEDGSLKLRGVEARRGDTPEFVKATQVGMMEILAEAHNAAGFRAAVPAAVAYARGRLEALRAGEVPLDKLLVSQRLSRPPEEYSMHTALSSAARQLAASGVSLRPGERVRFLHVAGGEKARPWEQIEAPIPYDCAVYTELLLRAIETVLAPVGVDRRMLETWLLGNAGYWGPPGALPPVGVDARFPLLAGENPLQAQEKGRRPRLEGVQAAPNAAAGAP